MIFNLNSAYLCVIALLIVCCECHRDGVKGGVKSFDRHRDSDRRHHSGESSNHDSDEHNEGGRRSDSGKHSEGGRDRDGGRRRDNGEHNEGGRNRDGGRYRDNEGVRNHEGAHTEDCGHENSHSNGGSSNYENSNNNHNQRNQFNRDPSYGWGSFDKQPSRTYDGVIQSSDQSGFDQNYNQHNNQMGWNSERWNQGSISPQNLPPASPLFNSNFNPGAFFPNFGNVAPYPAYPSFSGFPQPQPGYQGHNQDRFNPANQFGGGMTPPDRRVGSNGFSTNSFFFNPGTNIGNSYGNREWNRDDEMKWQATTKKPYFENKQPGRDCVLPAAAVLGAASAFGVSSLLPLLIPIGKPILSCNATDLQQTQIMLSGNVYDCNRRAITMSCPKTDEFDNLSDDCQGETLECDVRMRPTDEARVSCTNGTLISNHLIVCKSATLMENKNILNCFYKKESVSGSSSEDDIRVTPLRTSSPRPAYQTTSVSRPAYQPSSTSRPAYQPSSTSRPAYQPSSTSRPAYQTVSTSRPVHQTNTVSTSRTTSVFQSNNQDGNDLEDNSDHLFGAGDSLDTRVSSNKVESNHLGVGLMSELNRAMYNVFPNDLFAMRTKMYLPPKESMPSHFSPELKDLVNNVFPSNLLAMSSRKQKPLRNSGISTDLRNAMENVFPSDLLAVPLRPVQMVTPRSTQMPSYFSPELHKEMEGTFPSDLLASSTRNKETTNESETQSEFQNINEKNSRGQQITTDNENQNAFRETTRQTQVSDSTRTEQSSNFDARWTINPNSKSSGNGVKTFRAPTNLTPDQQSHLSTRFSSDNNQEQHDDRLIFSNK